MSVMSPLYWLLLLLANRLSALVAAASGGCQSDSDCSMLGTCAAGGCSCGRGWVGEYCEKLDLLPLDRSALVSNSSGLNELASSSTSTWGGAAVPQRHDQQWHMMYSEMQNKCGINSWLSNSAVRHAISRSPLGDRKSVV